MSKFWMVMKALLFLPALAASVEPCEWTLRLCGFDDPLITCKSVANSKTETSERAMWEAFSVGIGPDVKVTFQEPTHPTHLKPQRLEVLLTSIPLLDNENCEYERCQFGWYAPMPVLNGSVVHRVKVTSNGLGEDIPDKTFAVNVNGYVQRKEQEGAEFTLGKVIPTLEAMMTIGSPSRPLWAVVGRAPVLVLPGIPEFSAVLLTANEFQHTALIEVATKSPMAHSMNCSKFSFMVQEAIATESTIIIRQNQQLYRFTGNYSLLPLQTPPSESWEQVLGSVCISSLMPVAVPYHGREYFYVLGRELDNGTLYRAQIYDGVLTFTGLFNETACVFVNGTAGGTVPNVQLCHVKWAALYAGYSVMDIILVELIPHPTHGSIYQLLLLENDTEVHQARDLPKFLPKGWCEKGNSDVALELRGMVFNPVSRALYLWGNALLYSLDVGLTYAFFSGFPMDKMIKYFTLSYHEEFAFVTDDEELWWGQEGADTVMCLRPSRGWEVFSSLQQLRAHQPYSMQHSLLTVFFDWDKQLQEVVYMVDSTGNGSVIKRTVPVPEILYYNRFDDDFSSSSQRIWEHVEPVPHPERYNRAQLYQLTPPLAATHSSMQTPANLTTYSALLQHILWLHTAYTQGLGDPVLNPVQHLWKDQIVYEDFDVKMQADSLPFMSSELPLPDEVYLDRHDSFSFSIFITVESPERFRQGSRDRVSIDDIRLSVEVSDVKYLQVTVVRKEQLAQGLIFNTVTVKDRGSYVGQAMTGEKLLPFSLLVQVIGSEMPSYKKLDHGFILQGHHRVPIYIGCPPGKRMLFDLTTTLEETTLLNKQYFNCPNPELGEYCFYYKHLFYPIFSIQDVVSGVSERFLGSYTFKVVGGGPSRSKIRYYSHDEILKFNALNNSMIPQNALLWTIKDRPKSNKFTEDGFIVISSSTHIKWLCQWNSPCGLVLPTSINAPDFFFLIEVSNKGSDNTTYCGYTFRFQLHIHGLPLNPTVKVYIVEATIVCILSIILGYICVNYQRQVQRSRLGSEPLTKERAIRTENQ